ncbi:Ig-like domain-containing protein [Brevibacillus formosus]
MTRYGLWTPFITLHVDNPAKNVPKVSIDQPEEQSIVGGQVQIEVSVQAKNKIQKVEVRTNSGPWQQIKKKGSTYKSSLDTSVIGDQQSFSIEAQATDVLGHVGKSMTVYARKGTGTSKPIVVEPQNRAMWIWENASYNLFLNPGSRIVLDALAKDTDTFQSDGVTTLYLGIDKLNGKDIMKEQPNKVRNFVAWAHSKGYKVHATIAGGTAIPYLGAFEQYHDLAVRTMEEIINYNLSSAPSEQFDGVNVDIEPYIHPAFRSDKPSLQIQYLDGLQKMIQRRDAAGINLPFGTVIPRWYDTSDTSQSIPWNGSTKWLSEHIQEISDYIAIMDYRDAADGTAGIIASALGELGYANAIGKPLSVVVAVETLDIADGGDPETITFREEGRTFMESELDKVYAAFADNPSFSGIAMHHYDSIRYLPSDWGPNRATWQPPPDDTPPSSVSISPVATSFDYQRIDIQYGRAYDNTEVEEYYIYRGTNMEFTPDPSNLAGRTRGLVFRDAGLLPNTTYYYKVAAVDARGNIGPVSEVTAAATKDTSLKPMIIESMDVTHTETNAKVSLRVVDKETHQGIAAAVHGHFTYGAGKYISGSASPDGVMTAASESVAQEILVGFEPRGITADGYYWAQAYDNRQPVSSGPHYQH